MSEPGVKFSKLLIVRSPPSTRGCGMVGDILSIEDLCEACHPDKRCTRFLWVAKKNIDRWKAEGRQDVLNHIRERVVEGRAIREVKSPGKGCYFLKNGWCSVHETKPIVCRTFLCLKGIELKAKNNW